MGPINGKGSIQIFPGRLFGTNTPQFSYLKWSISSVRGFSSSHFHVKSLSIDTVSLLNPQLTSSIPLTESLLVVIEARNPVLKIKKSFGGISRTTILTE